MSHIIFLTPSSVLPADANALAEHCKENLLTYLYVRIIEETLRPNSANLTFISKHNDWLFDPSPRVTTIDSNGIETLKFETAHYTVNYPDGTITFTGAITDIVRVDYNYFPFTDDQIGQLLLQSLGEISVLIYRPIDENSIHKDYRPVICRRLYTNLLKALLLEARDYFSVSVGGRNIDKTNVIGQINEIIKQNETQVLQDVNVLRNFNKTKRLLPAVTTTQIIDSTALVI